MFNLGEVIFLVDVIIGDLLVFCVDIGLFVWGVKGIFRSVVGEFINLIEYFLEEFFLEMCVFDRLFGEMVDYFVLIFDFKIVLWEWDVYVVKGGGWNISWNWFLLIGWIGW